MSDRQQNPTDGPDFARLWSEWISETERQWNTTLNEMMGSQQFSQSLGGLMDAWLAMQKTVGEQMGRQLNAMNMPSRSDILAVNDRLLDIENRLAQIEAALNARSERGGESGSDTAARPARTRKPPESAQDEAR